MKRILFVLTILLSFNSFAQNNKHSLLWEISGNGLKTPSYLYGTMHVSNKIAFHLGDSFYIALDQAELVCLESDPSHWIDHMYGPNSGKDINGYSQNSGYNSNNFYENIVDISPPEKKTMEYALRKKHALENGFLYRGSAYNDEYEENTYLDLFIYQYAKKNNKDVLNLEDYKETNILQIKAMMPDEDEDSEEKKKKRKKQKSYSSAWNKDLSVGEAMEEAYRDGNIEIIDSITRITAQSDNYLHYFLHERNRIMTVGIDSLAKQKSIFIGIGAAHLPGKKGVVQMLKDLGYSMRPVERKITKFAKDKKNNIEEKFADRIYKPYTTRDGYITVSVPNNLYETPGSQGELQYFFPDMSNGGYFFVSRFQTFAPLNQMNATKWEAKIDSIIFENVEGKIIKQEKLKVGKYNAIDILNKSRKGEYQRRLIVFTPLEVILFKMAGTGEWAKIYGDRFIKSVKINDNQNQPQTYVSHLGEYSIDFPSTPISTVHAHEITDSPLHYSIQSFNDEDSSYFLLQHDWMNDFGYIEEDSFEVAYLMEIFTDQYDSLQTLEIQPVNDKNATGFAVLKDGDSLYFKSELRNNFYFLLTAKSTKSKANKFFKSFKYTNQFQEDKYVTYHDTLLRYTVNTPVVPDEMDDWLKVLRSKRNTDQEDWDYVKDNRNYFYKKNYESIYVTYLKHSDYYHMSSIDSLWDDEFDSYVNSELALMKKEIDNNDTMPTAHYVFNDTNSTKVIDIKKFVNKGVVYTIKATYDSTETRSKFVSEFFRTFTPDRDTLLGKEITSSNSALFFSDLSSNDTTFVKRAVELVNRVEFKPNDVDSIIWYIENYEFPDDDEEETALYLIRELGYIKNEDIIPYLVDKYERSTDDYKSQIACLKALARYGEKAGFKHIKKLIIQEPPITPNDRPISSFFRYLDDSLSLTAKLYPAMWDLLLYTDYRESLYDLSAQLLDSNLIKPKSYKREQPLILREAKEATAKKKGYSSGAAYVSLNDYSTYYSYGKPVRAKRNLIDQYELTTYLKLLMPYYKSNDKIKKYVHSLLTHKKEKYRFISTVMLTKHNIAVPDSMFTNLSKSPDYRFAFYKALKNIGEVSKFDKTYLTQEALMASAIYSASSIDAEDSLQFVKKVYIQNKFDEGYLYFYKHQSTYSDKWYIHYAGLQPKDSTIINDETDKNYIEKKAASAFSEAEIDKEIDKLIKGLKLLGRERAKKNESSYYDY